MFFYLSKILSFISLPSFWVLLFIGIALLTSSKKVKIASLWVLIIATNPALFYTVAKTWESPFARQKKPTIHFNYGIVLGGMASFDTISNKIQFNQAADRLFQGVELFKEGKIDTLIICGGSAKIIKKERLEASFLKDYCKRIGLDASRILIDSLSRNTHENALYAARIIQSDTSKILLITSAYHMPRALKCFNKVGLKPLTYGADALTFDASPSIDEYLIPSVNTLAKWDKLIHEWIGYIAYKIKGYI